MPVLLNEEVEGQLDKLPGNSRGLEGQKAYDQLVASVIKGAAERFFEKQTRIETAVLGPDI